VAQLSTRYATALYNLSNERGMLSEYLNQAVFLRDTLREPDCLKVITHPRITAKEKRAFFENAFSEHVSKDMLGFLCLAVNKNREKFIIPALNFFIDMANRQFRRSTALVISAVSLSDEQTGALSEMLSKKLDKQVDISVKVDPSIIGGLYIQVDGYFIDRTIKNRLRDINSSLHQ